MTENGSLFDCCHPLQNEDQAREVQRIGEVEYNSRLKGKAFEWVRENPGRFVGLTAMRIWYFWVPRAPEELRTFAFRLLSALSLFPESLFLREPTGRQRRYFPFR